MKLSTRQDIDAPAADVFSVLSDTARWERAALRRGAEVQRLDGGQALADGASWKVRAEFRGKTREVTLNLIKAKEPDNITFAADANLFAGEITVDLIALSARQTRVTVGVEVKPKTLPARIMLQSAKLAKGSMQNRFSKRVGQILGEIGSRLEKA